ncbi:histone H3-lysine(4) N-trimethyltransferase ATX1-like [Bidens hawaiensis]|uniref:histone H3-lysine(4) N-trimethyltransferase ATX1-like n=1 Tax=Bidens hawaiensis TaxID=980011 RepID=UPI00404AA9AE
MAFSSQLLSPTHPDDQQQSSSRYVPLDTVYSATSPCTPYSNVMSKKVKAKRLPEDLNDVVSLDLQKPPLVYFYSRNRLHCTSGYDTFVSNLKALDVVEVKVEDDDDEVRVSNKKRKMSQEVVKLGLGLPSLDASRPRGVLSQRRKPPNNRVNNGTSVRRRTKNNGNASKKNGGEIEVTEVDNVDRSTAAASRTKRWVRLKFDGVDPQKFVGLQCKVYWPLDADWYFGRIAKYDTESHRHHVEYEDGDEEMVVLSKERIKFHVSAEEIKCLKLACDLHSSETDDLDVNEMIILAANLDDCHDIEPGDIIWAKVTGHTVWPAIVLDESFVGIRRGLNKISGEKSVLVQFFGTHDFARVKTKQVISFLKGLLSSFHLKCKKLDFIRSLEEAKMYLSRQKLPRSMLQSRKGFGTNIQGDSEEDESKKISLRTEIEERKFEGLKSGPFIVGDLEVLKLGKIVKDVDCFDDEESICPIGYTATRKFPSLADPSVCSVYKMEVLRDAGTKSRPLFRVTTEDGDQFDGPDPSTCWNNIYQRIRKMLSGSSDNSQAEDASESFFKLGADMFGFSDPHVLKLIQGISRSTSGRTHTMPVGYRPVHVKWKDLDKCNVCHMDEEYANNLFLQCDKCRMMVHARCYGELEPVDGVLWLCNLCCPGAPEVSPPCCLCPVIGGAMKPTTDGRWAHLACAMWIPETCLSDIKKMEPIDGLNRVSKDRWKLLCSICGVPYGACIQCSNNACYVAYHPLCARAAGFCAELADSDRLQLVPIEEDEENQCIRLLSFCKRHSPNSTIERTIPDERIGQISSQRLDYARPVNPSGCARTEPYDFFGRRGRKEPEVLAAASLKRAYVENVPYLEGGFCHHESLAKVPYSDIGELKNSLYDESHTSIFSMPVKYVYMRTTFRKRLAFGKSAIHGFGIFAKQPHKAGDMVIEYTGEIVRPSIADRREHLIYNSLVGAGTYMFRIDDERVIDATRAGSIAHLINHSCEPNCYSRVISVNGDEHIIIFAKRDIAQWEELTYDYRFFSIDEQLSCYCGFPSCRGVVNDIDTEAQMGKLYAPRSELKDWKGE